MDEVESEPRFGWRIVSCFRVLEKWTRNSQHFEILECKAVGATNLTTTASAD